MTVENGPPLARETWRRQLAIAAGCAVFGLVTHFASPLLPPPVQLFGLGVGLVGAAFMLAWAADAGEAVFSGGLVLAVVALVAVLPEFTIEIRFAFIQAAELVTANLTGATRLLLAGATTLPLLTVWLASRRGTAAPTVELSTSRRLELGVLLVTSVFAVQIAIRGTLTVFDAVVLIGLYVVYATHVRGTPDEEPAVVGVGAGLLTLPERYQRPAIVGLIVLAGTAVIIVANPFADALLHTGASLGIDPYLLIQSVVPAATEAPEFVVVTVLVVNHRPAQGLALLLASSVSQWTLALGLLPVAYLAGGGGPAMPLAVREQVELGFTIALTLFVVAALATLRPARSDAWLMAGVFLAQIIYPSAIVRIAAGFVLFVFAVDLMFEHRRHIPALVRSMWGR
jgi:cation:H+ antiporter